MTKVPSKTAADLKNNFYLLPKVQKRIVAKDQTRKLVEIVSKTKENRQEALEMRKQSLARLYSIQTLLRVIDGRVDRQVQDQIKTMAEIQSALDMSNCDDCREQCESELRASIGNYSFSS